MPTRLTRRAFVMLSLVGGAAVSAVVAGCGSASPSPTQAPAAPAAPTTAPQSTTASAATSAPVPTAAVAPTAAPTSAPQAAAGAANGNTAVVALDALYTPPDPGLPPSFDDWYILQNICEPLLEVNLLPDQTTETKPSLAESWEKSADNSVWTFKLRKNVTFHDGTPFNAQAVLFSHDRLMNPNNPNYNKLYEPIGGVLRSIVAKMEAPDDSTVRFTLTDPPNSFFPNWERTVRIVSPTAVAKYGKDFGSHIVGTGPFKLDKYDPAAKTVQMSKFANYWESGLPKLDKVIWKVVDEPATRLAQLETGAADLATNIPPEFASRITSNPSLALNAIHVPGWNSLEFYIKQTPFEDKRLRQAIAYALDRKTLTSVLYGDTWTPAINNRFPGLVGWSTYSPYPYDPAKAKALLAQAGHPSGLTFKLIQPTSSIANPAGNRWSQVIQEQLGKVGLNATINVIESSSYWTGLNTPQPDLAHYMSRQVWVGDVVNEWLLNWIKPLPYGDAPVPGTPAIWDQLQKTGDPQKRDELIGQIWKLFDDELPYISLSVGSWIMPYRKALQGLRLLPMGEWVSFKQAHF